MEDVGRSVVSPPQGDLLALLLTAAVLMLELSPARCLAAQGAAGLERCSVCFQQPALLSLVSSRGRLEPQQRGGERQRGAAGSSASSASRAEEQLPTIAGKALGEAGRVQTAERGE